MDDNDGVMGIGRCIVRGAIVPVLELIAARSVCTLWKLSPYRDPFLQV